MNRRIARAARRRRGSADLASKGGGRWRRRRALERLKGGKTRSEFMRRAHTRGAGQELRVGRFKPLRRRRAVVDSGSRPAVDGAGRDSREPDRGGCETTRVPRAAGEAGLRALARVPACSTSDGDRRIQIDFCRPTAGRRFSPAPCLASG